MKQPEKSKSFKYNLGLVLHVRQIFEKQEKEKFAKAVQEHQKQLKKEEEMKDYQKNMQKTLAGKLRGKISDFANVMHRHEFLKKYKGDVVETNDQLCDLLISEAKVASITGSAFGSDKHVRFSFATTKERFALGVERIKNFLKQLD